MRLLIIPILLLCYLPTLSQDVSPATFLRLEDSIRLGRRLDEVAAELGKIRELTSRSKEDVELMRSLYLLMLTSDKRSEDSLFWENASFMDSIIDSPGPGIRKTIAHLLKAKRLRDFNRRILDGRSFRIYKSVKGLHYARMTAARVDSIMRFHLDMAAAGNSFLIDTDISRLLWLADDPLIFFFRPGFADIVGAQRVNVSKAGVEQLNPITIQHFLGMPPGKLLDEDAVAGQTRMLFPAFLRAYQQWADIHSTDDAAARGYIELLARKDLADLPLADSTSAALYESVLLQQLSSPLGTVRAFAVMELAERWVKESERFFVNMRFGIRSDTSYRLFKVKALELINQHRPLLDSFKIAALRLDWLRGEILRTEADWQFYTKQLPAEPILSMIRYRNLPTLHIRIVKINAADSQIDRGRLKYLHHPTIRDTVYNLPVFADYQWHQSYLKLDPLPAGHYMIYYSERQISEDDKPDVAFIQVTNIVTLNNDHKVFVLDGKTGYPLQEATVRQNGKQYKLQAGGFAVIRNLEKKLEVISGRDTAYVFPNEYDPEIGEDMYDKEEYDGLIDYYEENVKLAFFTDRAIYRPGQTVHYKVICMVPDPRSGELRVLNWKNIRLPFFKKIFYKIAMKLAKQKVEVDVSDPFGRVVETINGFPDRFGSFSGSFVLAKNAATGRWDFDVSDFDVMNTANSSFYVEEYKRPSFQAKIRKPEKELKLGDRFTFVISARSYAGAALNNVSIRYTVKANSYGFTAEGIGLSDTIQSGTLITDETGEVKLNIIDSLFEHRYQPDWQKELSRTYYIKVQATDNTGESRFAESSITLSTRPVKLKAAIPSRIDASAMGNYYISASSDLMEELRKTVHVKLRRLPVPKSSPGNNLMGKPDAWLHREDELRQWFPAYNFDGDPAEIEQGEVVFETTIQTNDEKLHLPEDLLPASYMLEMTCLQHDSIMGTGTARFSIFDSKKRLVTSGDEHFFVPLYAGARGEDLTLFTGSETQEIFSIYHVTYFVKGRKTALVKNEYDVVRQSKGLTAWKYKLPLNAVGQILITHQYVLNNHLYFKQEEVFVSPLLSQEPELIVEQYRTRLKPGDREVFKVSLKSKDLHAVTQLMTTMYDASLDALQAHSWKIHPRRSYEHPETEWEESISDVSDNGLFIPSQPVSGILPGDRVLWWSNGMLFKAITEPPVFNPDRLPFSGRLAGLISGISPVEEVIAIGYGFSNKLESATSSIRIRGATSLANYKRSLIILDGQVFEGDLSSVDINLVTSGLALMGADATALYGSRAAQGVLLLSTKGPVKLPIVQQAPPVVRKNFSETALFYPKLLADKNGMFSIQFTLPESVTEWKWKLLAHTTKAQFAYAERTIVSQLPMMVQPEIPAFLYQGDQLVLKSRISNLDSSRVSGTIRCVIEDAVTGDDLSDGLLKISNQTFTVQEQSNDVYSFRLSLPDTMIHPLRVRIIAESKNASDGEEHLIPVLTRKTLISQSVPLTSAEAIRKPLLPADAGPYGMSVYLQPFPNAALLNALPYLSTYAFDCTEQTFNKILAHALAAKLMRTDSSLQHSYNEYVKNPRPELTVSDSLAETRGESMPWLRLEFATQQQQRSLFALLDTLDGERKINAYLDLIAQRQQQNGGVAWFSGGKSDPYISLYLLAGFGKMKRDSLKLFDRSSRTAADQSASIVKKLISYADNYLIDESKDRDMLGWFYARSFWIKEYPLSSNAQQLADSLVAGWLQQVHGFHIGRIATLISAIVRSAPAQSSMYQQAMAELESLRQQAIIDGNGVRWKIVSDDDDLVMQNEELLIRIAEAFDESKTNDKTVKGVIEWLLRTKNDHHWSNTKATGEAVSLLIRHNNVGKQSASQAFLEAGFVRLQVSNDLLTGRLYDFQNIYHKGFPDKITVATKGPDQVKGGLSYYYFSDSLPVTDNGIVLKKSLSRYDATAKQWKLVDDDSLFIGDKVKVKLEIETKRHLQYVFIDDRRAAAFAPADARSGYRYAQGFSYYSAVGDEGYRFFAEKIPAGLSIIEYEMIVSSEGKFYNGISVLQCMYQPGIKAWSRGFAVVGAQK